jgi:hypothetical protein
MPPMKYWEVVADKVSAKRPGVTAAVHADVVTIGGLDLGEQDAHPDAACFDGHPMTKPMLVTVPFVLLVLDYWPLGRFAHVSQAEAKPKNGFARCWGHRSIPTRLILEKIPLIALSVASSIITLFAQKRAAISIESLPLV